MRKKDVETDADLAATGGAVLAAVGEEDEKEERAGRLREAFGPSAANADLWRNTPGGSRWPVGQRSIVAGYLSQLNWRASHGRLHGWKDASCDEPHCGPRPPHLSTRASRKRESLPSRTI